MPQGSLLPKVAGWLTAGLRGLLAMAPPPPPPAAPCPGIPAPYDVGVLCGDCPTPPWPAGYRCAFIDGNSNGVIDAGEGPSAVAPAPLPLGNRGFDDPQADPDLTLVSNCPAAGLLPACRSIDVRYVRGDLFDLGSGPYDFNDLLTGNPPWGSQAGDADADGAVDAGSNRRNQGAYVAVYDTDRGRQQQQFPNDGFGEPSSPFPPAPPPCDPQVSDCGGIAKFSPLAPQPSAAPSGYDPYPVVADPPAPTTWPVIPFPREWESSDTDSKLWIKKLLRFASAIVEYNPGLPATSGAYRLAESANNVATTAPGTPIAGALYEAYRYFVDSVFPEAEVDDPAKACRAYIIVLITDGQDESGADPCTAIPDLLADVPLPDYANRVIANAVDPEVRTNGIEVYPVFMGRNTFWRDQLECITREHDADPNNDNGRVLDATDRGGLLLALESILDFKRSPNVFAAPALPSFSGGISDTAQVGAVIPSHENGDGSLSQWSIWSGSLKSFKLDGTGRLQVVSAAGTATPSPTAGVGVSSLIVGFPDETDPDNANPALRKPLWNAGRVLGYTDPVANLGEGQGTSPGAPSPQRGQITVWPGRKMIWAEGSGVPLTRRDFLPNTGTCAGACFDSLITTMGLSPVVAADRARAALTVQFLRGGMTAFGSRDEILNVDAVQAFGYDTDGDITSDDVLPGALGWKYSYRYQDNIPAPGAPQVQTDDDGDATPNGLVDGYPHKLGDIFHSEPRLIEPPREFAYLALGLEPVAGQSYLDFALLHQKRRRVVFVGANDGFFHAFDAGVYDRDTTTFPNQFDLGTGREVFAYAPRGVMRGKFPALIGYPPKAQYFVDGSLGTADVFIDPAHGGTPTSGDRRWRTIVVGTLRQGGPWVFALDVTQPDQIDTVTTSPTFGEKIDAKDDSPDCLNSGGGACASDYPSVMWELTDDCALMAGCEGIPRMGETWSKPVVGRIRVTNAGVFEDRYVAIFGGGYDPRHKPGDPIQLTDVVGPPAVPATRGRAVYVVDVETGRIIYKATAGFRDDSVAVNFAPMPAAPGAIDWDDDGYLDAVYIADVNGRIWRLDLVPEALSVPSPRRGELIAGKLQYRPFLLYDASTSTAEPIQPFFLDPALIFVSGGPRPTIGVGIGAGDRAELPRPNLRPAPITTDPPIPYKNRSHFVVDSGQLQTAEEDNLRDITPVVGDGAGPFDSGCADGTFCTGFRLDYETVNEKATSTMFITDGFLSLVTFTPDTTNPCATEGNSFRYRFFFLTGESPLGLETYADYRENLGGGYSSSGQSSTKSLTNDWIFSVSGGVRIDTSDNPVSTINQNWKEQ
jgi:hypothetical protein